MSRKKFLIRIASFIFFIFILNYLAGKFYWFSAIWYFDMIMHFLGGFWLGLVSFWFLSSDKNTSLSVSFKLICKVLFFVLLIGIGWEIFELYFINHIAKNPFDIVDTGSDLFFDLSGGLVAILYFFKRIMGKKENRVK